MRLRTLVGAGLGVCLCLQMPLRVQAQAQAQAQPQVQAQDDGLEAALKLPLTPASVALLVLHVTAPAAQHRLADALKDSRADVRAVAARVVFVSHIGELKSNLLDALDAEQDAGAAVEEIRAAVLVGGAAADARILAAASRLGDPLPHVYVASLVRTRPADFVSRASTLLPLLPNPASAGEALATAALHRQLIDGVFDQLTRPRDSADRGETDVTSSFFQFLEYTTPDTVPIVARALHASQEQVRVDAVLTVASLYLDGSDIEPDILSMIAATPPVPGSRDGFAYDMLGRVMGKPATGNWADLLREHPPQITPPLDAWLTKEEFAALPPQSRPHAEQSKRFRRERHPVAPPETPRARTLPAFSAALLPDLFKATGCDARGVVEKAVAQIHYDAAGRPKRVMVGAEHPTPSCDEALRAAAALTVAADTELRPIMAVDLVYFAIDPALADCAAAAGALAPGLARTRRGNPGFTQEPQPTYQPQPYYSTSARDRHAEGVVWVNAVITAKGCVSDESAVHPLDPELDLEALRAIARWKFRPAQLDGHAVASNATIEISYRGRH